MKQGICRYSTPKVLTIQQNNHPHLLVYVSSKSKVTQSISNLQEWYWNTQIGKYLFAQRIIHYKSFTLEKKICSEGWHWASGHFMNVFYETTTYPRKHIWMVTRMVVLWRFDCTSFIRPLKQKFLQHWNQQGFFYPSSQCLVEEVKVQQPTLVVVTDHMPNHT